jgi:protein TonB
MATAHAHESTFIPRRVFVFLTIVGLHVLLGYGLATGLARKVVEVIAPPIETDIIEEMKKQEEPPPPPPPEFERPPVEVPPPEVAIDIPIDTSQSTAIQDVTNVPRPAPPPPPRAVVRTPPRPDQGRFPSSEEYYPASAKRLNQQGSPTVRACVGTNGRLAEAPTIAQSSGVPALDDGAIKLAKAGRYIPGTEDGKPVAACFTFRVKFELKD